MVLGPWELMGGVELKCKIMLNYSRRVSCQQGITTGFGFCVYNVLG